MPRKSPLHPTGLIPRLIEAVALGLLAGAIASPVAVADDWPTRPIKILVPGASGSTSDLVTRVVANGLTARLGQPFVIVDKPGAGGTIAMAELARAEPDGYTIAFATQGSLIFGQALYHAPGFDTLRDFAPVAFVGSVANVLVVNAANPARRPSDIVVAAQRNPGTITYASGGNGSSHHLSALLFARMTGVELVHVAYRSPPLAIQAVLSGDVTMGFFNTPSVIAQVRNGTLKAIAVTSRARSALLPDVPTLDEQGVRGYDVTTWFGFIAPKETPAAIVARLNGEINGVLSMPTVKANWTAQGYDVAAPMTSRAFAQFIGDEMAKWTPIVKASGASVN